MPAPAATVCDPHHTPEQTHLARILWNVQFECPAAINIRIEKIDECTCESNGALWCVGKCLDKQIIIDPRISEEFVDLLIAHEVGHALGRHHSKSVCSVMYPIIDKIDRRCVRDVE